MRNFQAKKNLVFLWLAIVFMPTRGLENSVQPIHNAPINMNKNCSRRCESEFCTVPPLLRYGKYCGLLYSGCPGEPPCDDLDACCMKHDACVVAKNNDYLSQECTQSLMNCLEKFKRSEVAPFEGNKCQVHEVIDVISFVMDAALIAARIFRQA